MACRPHRFRAFSAFLFLLSQPTWENYVCGNLSHFASSMCNGKWLAKERRTSCVRTMLFKCGGKSLCWSCCLTWCLSLQALAELAWSPWLLNMETTSWLRRKPSTLKMSMCQSRCRRFSFRHLQVEVISWSETVPHLSTESSSQSIWWRPCWVVLLYFQHCGHEFQASLASAAGSCSAAGSEKGKHSSAFAWTCRTSSRKPRVGEIPGRCSGTQLWDLYQYIVIVVVLNRIVHRPYSKGIIKSNIAAIWFKGRKVSIQSAARPRDGRRIQS